MSRGVTASINVSTATTILNANDDCNRNSNNTNLTFSWGDLPGELFKQQIELAYQEVVYWRKNLFYVPYSAACQQFVSELSQLFQSYAHKSAIEPIAIKAAMVMPHLLLQKPHRNSKAKDHTSCWSCCLSEWKGGNIENLLTEAKSLRARALE